MEVYSKVHLYNDTLAEIQVNHLKEDGRMKYLYTQMKKFLDRQISAHFLFSNDTFERILFNSLYRKMKKLSQFPHKRQEDYLERIYGWFKKQKEVSKQIRPANALLDFDKLMDNVELIKDLTNHLDDFKISQQKKYDAIQYKIKLREKLERAIKRHVNIKS